MMHALAVMGEHRLYKIRTDIPFDDVEQRMQGTIGVPNGKDGIVCKALGLVDVVVDPSVFPVYIHINGRVDHRMVQRCVKHG